MLARRALLTVLSGALAVLPLRPALAAQDVQAGTLDDLRARYPEAQVIRVTVEDYPALAHRLRDAGYQPQSDALALHLAAAGTPQNAPPSVPAPQPAPAPAPAAPPPGWATSDCDEAPTAPPRREGQVGVDIRVGSGGHGGGRGSGSEAAVIFVIIGTVVLMVWTLYAIKYLVDLARGVNLCGRRWNEWSFTSSGIESYRPQYAYFNGLRYIGGVSPGVTGFGISAELGQADVLLSNPAGATLRLQGTYWLLGPLLRWQMAPGPNPHYLQMEFQVGSTENKEMGTIATAKLGFNFGLAERLRLGVSYGAMNMNLHEQGVILDRSQYYTLWGVDVGWRF